MKEENEEKKFIGKNRYEQFSRKARFCIFTIFIVLAIIMSADNGVLSSSKKQVRRDLQLDEKGYGILCSLSLVGRMFGNFVIMDILKFDRRKLFTCSSLFIIGSLFFAYSFTFNKYILCCIRFLIGLVRMYLHIYSPMWVDQFGIKKHKIMMMTLINITSPLGLAIGNVLGTINEPEKWYLNYKILGELILGLGGLLLLFPTKFFSARYYFVGYKKEGEEGFVRHSQHQKQESFFELQEMRVMKRARGSMIEILKNPIYFFSAFVKANFLFCFQVIYFNITSYAVDDLKMPEKETITFLLIYSFALIFGMFIGGMFGGLCVSSVGGYEHKKSAFLLACFALVTFFSSLIVIYSDTVTFMCIGLFLFFFFSSALLPIIGGYIVTSIPRQHKGAGSSLNNLITNFLGNIPGLIIYGFLKDTYKETNPKLPWKIIIHMSTFGILSSLGSAFLKYRQLSKFEDEENKEKQE